MSEAQIKSRVGAMQALLNTGKILDAYDEFYRSDARFFENGYPFADSLEEARARQASFVDACERIDGEVELVHTDAGRGITVLHNRTAFDHPEYGSGRIDGVHVSYWHDGLICREEYFSGERVDETLAFWRLMGRAGTR
jgi:hypothetical protein